MSPSSWTLLLAASLFVSGFFSFIYGASDIFMGSKKGRGIALFLTGWGAIAAAIMLALNLIVP